MLFNPPNQNFVYPAVPPLSTEIADFQGMALGHPTVSEASEQWITLWCGYNIAAVIE